MSREILNTTMAPAVIGPFIQGIIGGAVTESATSALRRPAMTVACHCTPG